MVHDSATRKTILRKISDIMESNLQGVSVKVYLYGSWARRQEHRTSDIDLAIWSDAPLPTGLLAKLRAQFEEAPIAYPIEVVYLPEADEAFILKVKREGIEWRDWSND